MGTFRTHSLVAGVLFILATASGVAAGIVSAPILGAEEVLAAIASNSGTVRLAGMLEVVMAIAIAGIAIALLPVLWRFDRTLATAHLGLRLMEGVMIAVGAAAFLAAIPVANSGVDVMALDALSDAAFGIGATLLFSLSALVLNAVLLRARLVPWVLSVWGLIGGVLLLTSGVLDVFGMQTETGETYMALTIAVQEMALAVWLIVKGFDLRMLSGTPPTD